MAPERRRTFAAATFAGTCSVASNDFVFRATGCSPHQPGAVFVSPTTAYVPSGAGYLCVGPGLQRLGYGIVDAAGNFTMPIDLSNRRSAGGSYLP